jgi:hypothetical protein
MDRVSLNDAAWTIVDRAQVKTRPNRKRKLTARQQEYESFKRSEESMRLKRLNGSQGAAGPCMRIDPLTGETIGVVKRNVAEKPGPS